MEIFRLFGSIFIDNSEAEQSLSSTESKFEKLGGKISDIGGKITDTGKSLTTKVTAPIIGIVAAAAKVGIEFEAGMSEVAAVSGATGKDLERLEAKAREMGAATSFSAKDAADGLKYMALAGWDTEKMLGGLEPILHLAEAGALDLGRASDLTTDSMAALGLGVEDLDGYLDKVAQTSRKSNTDIDMFMEAMVVAGGTFSRFNVPLEEANAFLGVLANRGTKGSEAGTALNAIMDRLTSGTGQAATALEELGLSAFDSEGNFKGMEVTMREIRERLSGMTDEQKAHYQSMIAGLNHGKSFEKMLQGLGDEYDELKYDIINSDDALKEMRDTMKDNLQGRIESMKSALEEAGISIYENLKPALEALVAGVQKLADWFNNLSPTAQNMIVVIAGIAAAIGPVLIVIGTLISSIGSIVTAIGPVVSSVTNMGKVVGLLTNPVGLAIAAIAGIIAILVIAYNKVDWFREMVDAAWAKIKEFTKVAFEAISKTISSIVKDVVDFVKGLLDKFRDFWKENGEQIMELVKKQFDSIASTIKMVMGIIKGIFEVVWPIISNTVKIAWELIKTIVKTAIDIVLGIIQTVLKLLQGDWKGAWETIKKTVENIWDNIKTFFKNVDLLQVGKDIIQGLINGIGSMAGAVVNKVKDIANGIGDTVKNFFGIRSPSRLMMEYGGYIGEGLELGLDDSILGIKQTADEMANAAFSNLSKVDVSQLGRNGSSNRGASKGDVIVYQTIQSPKYLSPSETARLSKRGMQEAALEWR